MNNKTDKMNNNDIQKKYPNFIIYETEDNVAKNYLSELELQKLNLLTEGFLGYAELQALEQKSMTMNDWKNFLDSQLKIFPVNSMVFHGAKI
jgi:hypothetical protein